MNTLAHFKSRKIIRRVYIKANLKLLKPAILTGDSEDEILDMPLNFDPIENKPLLTGTSMAGALRNYLRCRMYGYGSDVHDTTIESRPLQEKVFGWQEGVHGSESWLITTDALALAENAKTEIRNGVALDPITETAIDGAKYDYEVLLPGEVFPIRFELLIPDNEELAKSLITGTAIALQGLEKGEIAIGAKKRRGFGICQVDGWEVYNLDLLTDEGFFSWLEWDWNSPPAEPNKENKPINQMLNAENCNIDNRKLCEIKAQVRIKDSMLIGSNSGKPDQPDTIYLQSDYGTGPQPILSGTSLMGPVRHRSLQILNTKNQEKAQEFINRLFGFVEKVDAQASRITSHETLITGFHSEKWVQNRLKIDRFTGGAYPGALFDEMPLFPTDNNGIEFFFELEDPTDAEIGLLLLVMRDIFTGDLTFGGGSGIGRGAVRGKVLTMSYEGKEWILNQDDANVLSFEGTGERSDLEDLFVKNLLEVMA